MIAQLRVKVIVNRGLVFTLALDITDAATNSNSLLPARLGLSGQCSGSLPAAAAADDDSKPDRSPDRSSVCRLNLATW